MRDLMEIVKAIDGAMPGLTRTGSYRAPDSALDYPGVDFDKYAIMVGANRVGEIDVQHGAGVATVRNVIVYRPDMTGKGIGKAVYGLLSQVYDGYEFRSSYSTNLVNGREQTGLSDQAIAMWDSLVDSGHAEKVGGDRFYYRMK